MIPTGVESYKPHPIPRKKDPKYVKPHNLKQIKNPHPKPLERSCRMTHMYSEQWEEKTEAPGWAYLTFYNIRVHFTISEFRSTLQNPPYNNNK